MRAPRLIACFWNFSLCNIIGSSSSPLDTHFVYPSRYSPKMGIPKFWDRSATTREVGESSAPETISSSSSASLEVIHDGDLTYTVAKAQNGSGLTYQEAVGAPVESKSPLGYHVGWVTVIFLNVNQMIGTGIFSTRKYTCAYLGLTEYLSLYR